MDPPATRHPGEKPRNVPMNYPCPFFFHFNSPHSNPHRLATSGFPAWIIKLIGKSRRNSVIQAGFDHGGGLILTLRGESFYSPRVGPVPPHTRPSKTSFASNHGCGPGRILQERGLQKRPLDFSIIAGVRKNDPASIFLLIGPRLLKDLLLNGG